MNSHASHPPDSDGELDSDDEFDSAPMSKRTINQFMAIEWLTCFQRNADFKAYCDAKRTGDDEMCSALEAEHTRIAELYEDWGDIHNIPSSEDNVSWKLAWFFSRSHLFELPEIEKSGLFLWKLLHKSDDAILVKIPKGLRKEQLLDEFADFVERNPEVHGDGPKYKIIYIKGERPEEALKHVRRASTAHTFLTERRSEGATTKSVSEKIVKEIAGNPEARSMLGLNWHIHGELNKKLFEQDKRSADEIKNYTRTLNNLNKFYAACIEGTIRGTFPATTKT